jgi:deazaflavin-dependent oxidoreductase (nitroreductase family)
VRGVGHEAALSRIWQTADVANLCGRRLLHRSNGRYTVLGAFGPSVQLLTTTGRKSGHGLETPLVNVRDGKRLFIVGSNLGQSVHPGWTSNLVADPKAWVTMRGEEIPVLATQLIGKEYDRISNTTPSPQGYTPRTVTERAANYDCSH